MSTEEEANNPSTKERKDAFYERILDYWPIGFKLVELLLCTLATALFIEPARATGMGSTSRIHHLTTCTLAFAGQLLTILILLSSRLLFNNRLPYLTTALFSIIGSMLSLSAGVLLLADRGHFTSNTIFHPHVYLMDMLAAAAVIGLVNGAVMAVDAVLVVRNKRDL